MLGEFYEQDTKGKRHLCLVLHVLGSSVEDLRLTNIYDGQYLALHVVQKIVGDISKVLDELADRQIFHGAVTADNFLFWTIQAAGDIEKEIGKFPTKKPQKITGSDGTPYAAFKSQPFDHGCPWDCSAEEVMHANLYLSNFAHAHHTANGVTLNSPKNFLPPEAFQGGRIDSQCDIWMLGCTTYLLLTGTPLFSDSYIASPIKTATETVGKLELLLADSGKIAKEDIRGAAVFLRSCLAIKPSKRVTAKEILQGGWIRSSVCSCGWNGY